MESIRNAAASAANTASSYIYGSNEAGTTGTTGTTNTTGTTGTSSSGLPESLGGSSNTGTGYGSSTGTSGITGQHNTSGPHDSDLANRADPRVDSDRDGSNAFGSTGTGYGSSTTGTSGLTGQHNTSGPHDSDLANRADPRVDSDRDGSSTFGNTGTGYGSSTTGTGYGSSTSGSGLTGGLTGSSGQQNTSGPHNSDLLNRADPRVDSDRDGSSTYGNTGSSFTGGNTGSSFTGGSSFTNTQSGTEPVSGETGRGTATQPYDQGNQAAEGQALSNHGPHNTFIGNILDPKTADSAREKTFGPTGEPEPYGGQTQSYGGQTQSYGGEAQSYGGQTQSYGGQTQSYGGQTQSYEGQPRSSEAGLGGVTGSQGLTSGRSDDNSSQSYLDNNPRYQGGKRIADHSPSPSRFGSSSLSGRSGTDNQGYESGQQSYGSTQQSGYGQGQDNSSTYSGSTLGGQQGGQHGGQQYHDRVTSQPSESRSLDNSSSTQHTSGGASSSLNAGGAVRPEHDTDKTGVHSFHQNDPHGGDIRPSEANENRPNVNAGGFGTAEPSVGADPKSAQQDTQKHQGGDRPMDEPSGKEADAVKEKKDEGEAALAKHDPNDHSGEPMHMHTGKEEKKEKEGEHPGQEGGGEHGKEKGTGEEWVKSSGLQADGGNFDASAPGAGREADRLLESKGIHKDERGAMLGENDEAVTGTGGDHAGDHEKKSGGLSKLKEKLHIGGSKH